MYHNSEIETLAQHCPICSMRLEKEHDFESEREGEAPKYHAEKINCPSCGYIQRPEILNDKQEVLRQVLGAIDDWHAYKIGHFKKNRDGNTLFALGNVLESVQLDMIKQLYLKESKIEIPETYFWLIRNEHPRLMTSDFIQHIWDIQNFGADPTLGEVQLITFKSRRLINGHWREVLSGSSSFHWSFFMKMISQEKDFDGFDFNVGVGKIYNVHLEDQKDDLFAECKVYRKNISRPIIYKAFLSEFCKRKFGKKISKRWENPEMMLKNIALINAMKLAFPNLKAMQIDYQSMNEGEN